MLSFHKLIFSKSSDLNLEQSIFNEILIILSIIGFLAGIQNLIIDYPLWIPVVFFFASFISISLFFYTQITNKFKRAKNTFIVILYLIIIINWFYNEGLNGGIVLFLLVATIYTIGIYNTYYYRLFVLNIAIFISLVLINILFPETKFSSYKNETDHILDMVLTYFLGSLSVVLILRTILNTYNKANDLIQIQKKELEFSHKEQLEANQLLDLKNKDLENINQIINEQTKQLNQVLITKDKLFSIIAHDLKNPISGILGISQLLQKRLKKFSDEKSEIYIEQLISSSLSSLNLLNNLLSWANLQTGKINIKSEELILQDVINEVFELLDAVAKLKNISLKVIFTDEVIFRSDRDLLQTILRNLVSNAIKFTKPGGEIKVSVISDRIQVIIIISDNGVGMNSDQLKKLFGHANHNSTVGTANEKGSGLGLVLCKEFTEKLGGKILVKSKIGVGSEFKVILPLKDQYPKE